ncbi:Rrf2 family transcriptional regulator [Phenylobacterium montanum]|uniref:Rrf2 family transcriptional regulator n=1 Tax=Phenylobacterium montanum TaxID=2823693 RepID=A0A975FV89_9CAUL|nr:Rrf2 family transcriptional regulator [Caulobacter sp. S6]QUD85930.1 Rrf2 family transcriptional regulator [Caulobacter sp. S6]
MADLGREDERAGPSIASALEDALVDQGWPSGQVFGPERVLASNFDAAVPRLRQALRILEGRGVCQMRRGPGGGLVVLPPSRRQAAELLADNLRWTGATAADVWKMRAWFEPMAAAAAADQGRLARSLSDASGDPCLSLLLECLDQFPGGTDESSSSAREALWRAIAEGSARSAAQIAAECVAQRQARATDLPWPQSGIRRVGAVRSSNLASQLARRIAVDITFARCRNREWLGAIQQLCDRYHASHGVMVEAIRMLEDAQVVESRRGRAGGITLRTPGTAAVVPLLHAHIAGSGASGRDVSAASRRLNGLAALEAAASANDRERWSREAQLVRVVPVENGHFTWLRLQREIYEAAGNPVLHAFGCCFAGYNVRAHAPGRDLSRQNGEALLEICHQLLLALAQGDGQAAAHGQNAGLDLLQRRDERAA